MAAPDRWQQVKQLFHDALERDPAARQPFLAEACGGDAELRDEVESLLLHHDSAEGFIEMSAFEATAQAFDRAVPPSIGPYKIIREIARGGMGAVYLAARDGEYRKQVAIKLIKRGMDTDFVVRRFLGERQILADLDHPNIARLYDGGTTTDGLPYFVMEYIEGQPIDRFCDEQRLTTAERLKLFRQICAAVHYAHQNLIIHRDLKPSNILVTKDGAVKLLDFGIAKMLSPEAAGPGAEATATAVRLMTPEYASPEQVKGEAITTASDVYSLGVVLYELLTGHRPYHIRNHLPHEIVQIVCQSEPEKPSTMISRSETLETVDGAGQITITPDSVSRTRGDEPARLRKRLAGDIDNIVLMAMRKEPQRRYSSVEQFAEDIRRHLEGLPVIARRDTLSYRATKFVRRNRLAVAAGALVVLTLIGGIVATAWQARVARRQRARAEQRFGEVRKLAGAMLFNYHDKISHLPGALPVREEMIKDGLNYLDSLAAEAGDDPSLQLELAVAYNRVGDIQGSASLPSLGDTAGALESYRKALGILEPLAAAGHKRLAAANQPDADVRVELAATYDHIGNVLTKTGDLEGAIAHQRRVIELDERLIAEVPEEEGLRVELGVTYGQLAALLGQAGEAVPATEEYRKGIELLEPLLARGQTSERLRREMAVITNNFGLHLKRAGDRLGALDYFRRALAIEESLAADNPHDVKARIGLAYLNGNIGNLLKVMKDLSGSLPYLHKALDIWQKIVSDEPKNADARHQLAIAAYQLAGSYILSGSFSAGLEYHRQAIAGLESLVQSDPNNAVVAGDLAYAHSLMANTHERMADAGGNRNQRAQHWREAKSWYQRSLSGWLALESRGRLANADKGEPERIRQAIAKCDRALQSQ